MKTIYFFAIAIFITVISLSFTKTVQKNTQTVNPILGDQSFIKKFGYKPNKFTDNNLRVKTHLQYVEELLRNKNCGNLNFEKQKKRNQILDLLHQYWTAGIFPKNYDYSNQRIPCFIDKDKNICAVGYLVQQTTNRGTAEIINSKYKYKEILEMNDPILFSWMKENGLTQEECAMIQPTYGPMPTYYNNNNVSKTNATNSAVLSGVNVSMNTLNVLQMGNRINSKALPYIGLLTGISQLVYGAKMFPENQIVWNSSVYTNQSLKTLSMLNIGLGTSTVLTSAVNLLLNHKPKTKKTAYNFYSYPSTNNNLGLALNITRKL